MRPERPAPSAPGTRRAATKVKEPGAARLAGGASGPSRERRPLPRHRERPQTAPPRERRPQHFPAAKPPPAKGWLPGRRGRMSGAGPGFARSGRHLSTGLAKPGAPPDREAGVPAGPPSVAAPCPAAQQSGSVRPQPRAIRSAPLTAPADRYRQAETRPRGSEARSLASSRRARSRRFTGARRLPCRHTARVSDHGECRLYDRANEAAQPCPDPISHRNVHSGGFQPMVTTPHTMRSLHAFHAGESKMMRV